MKIVPKNQNVPLDEVRADDAFEQVVEALDQPLEKVLCAAGNLRHPARGDLGKDDEADGDDPRNHHRVRDRKTEGPGDFDSTLRKAVLHGFGQREQDRVEGAHAGMRLSTAHAMRSAARRSAGMRGATREAPRSPVRFVLTSSGIPDALRDAGGAGRLASGAAARPPPAAAHLAAVHVSPAAGTAAANLRTPAICGRKGVS